MGEGKGEQQQIIVFKDINLLPPGYSMEQEARVVEGFNLSPEERAVLPSVFEAFCWVHTTDTYSTFTDTEREEFPVDDEGRFQELGNIYSYARSEGVPEEVIDRLHEHAQNVIEQESFEA